MISFKPRVGKVKTGLTSGGFTVIIPFKNYTSKICDISAITSLVKHPVITNGLCENCKLSMEDIVHALYRCPTQEKFGEE